MEAGSGELTQTCTVYEVITGLTNVPSAQWEGPSGTLSSGIVSLGDDITVTEVLRNATTTTLTLTLSPPHTSHAGEYTCQGMVDTPAPEGPVTSSSPPTNVTVRSEYISSATPYTFFFPFSCVVPMPLVELSLPGGPLYEGTRQTLTCTVTLPEAVDSDVTVDVEWLFGGSLIAPFDRVIISPVATMRPPFTSTLTLSPLTMSDGGQYTCQATADSASPYVASSAEGSGRTTLSVEGTSHLHAPLFLV